MLDAPSPHTHIHTETERHTHTQMLNLHDEWALQATVQQTSAPVLPACRRNIFSCQCFLTLIQSLSLSVCQLPVCLRPLSRHTPSILPLTRIRLLFIKVLHSSWHSSQVRMVNLSLLLLLALLKDWLTSMTLKIYGPTKGFSWLLLTVLVSMVCSK